MLTNQEIKQFYEISELNREDVKKLCSNGNATEEEFILEMSKTGKYAWKTLDYRLYKLFTLNDFLELIIVFFVGLILILLFVK